MTTSPRSLRKAAILVASLDPQHAEALLGQMTAAQASAVREAVGSLGEIDADEQGDVIEEFFRIGPLVPDDDAVGIELNAPLPASMLAHFSPAFPCQESPERGAARFRFLHEASAGKLVGLLEREHPQTIALVVSHLPTDRAAEILAQLPSALQTAVARRLVDLEETDPEVLREVERSLESRIRAEDAGEARRSAGVAALAGILGAAQPKARHEILANLARHDRDLAGKLEVPNNRPPSFADLERMDGSSLAVVLQQAEPELLGLALAGAAPRFAERALAVFGPQRSAQLRAALCNLGPTRLSDVEEAQQRLAELARELEQRGEIRPELRGRLSVAV